MLALKTVKNRIDDIILLGENVLNTAHTIHLTGYIADVSLFFKFRTSGLSFINQIYGTNHAYYIEFDKHVFEENTYSVNKGIGILQAIQNEVEMGWLKER